MLPMPVERLTDLGIGVCYGHAVPIPMTGVVVPINMYNTFVAFMPVATTASLCIGNCGHVGLIVSYSRTIVNFLPIARVTDPFLGTFTGTLIPGPGNPLTVIST